MPRSTPRLLSAGVALAGCLTGVALTSMPAHATEIGQIIYRATGSKARFDYVVDGSVVATQQLRRTGCTLAWSGDDLLNLQPDARVALVDGQLGIRSAPNCGSEGSLISRSEELTISLGDYFASDPTLAGAVVESADLVLGSPATANATGDLSTPAGPATETSGSFTTTTTWHIDTDFTALALSAGSGQLGIRTGSTLTLGTGDTTVVNDEITDTPVGCGTTTRTVGDGVEAPAVTFENARTFTMVEDPVTHTLLPVGSCDPGDPPITVTRLTSYSYYTFATPGLVPDMAVILDKPVNPGFEGLVTISWPVANVDSAPTRQISYTWGAAGESFHDVLPCGFGPAGQIIHPTVGATVEPWCLVREAQDPFGTPQHQIETYHGVGDPMWK